MSQIWNIDEATDRLHELVERAAAGEEIVIGRDGKPLARLMPLAPERDQITPRGGVIFGVARDETTPRPLGIARGQIWFAPDFDELPEDIQRAFEGEREIPR